MGTINNKLEHWLPDHLRNLEWYLTCDYQSVNTFSACYCFDSEASKDMVLKREIKELKEYLHATTGMNYGGR